MAPGGHPIQPACRLYVATLSKEVLSPEDASSRVRNVPGWTVLSPLSEDRVLILTFTGHPYNVLRPWQPPLRLLWAQTSPGPYLSINGTSDHLSPVPGCLTPGQLYEFLKKRISLVNINGPLILN